MRRTKAFVRFFCIKHLYFLGVLNLRTNAQLHSSFLYGTKKGKSKKGGEITRAVDAPVLPKKSKNSMLFVRLCACAIPKKSGNCGALRQNSAQQRLCEIHFCCARWSRSEKNILKSLSAIKIGIAEWEEPTPLVEFPPRCCSLWRS